jgi:hypothetical protein
MLHAKMAFAIIRMGLLETVVRYRQTILGGTPALLVRRYRFWSSNHSRVELCSRTETLSGPGVSICSKLRTARMHSEIQRVDEPAIATGHPVALHLGPQPLAGFDLFVGHAQVLNSATGADWAYVPAHQLHTHVSAAPWAKFANWRWSFSRFLSGSTIQPFRHRIATHLKRFM